MSGIFGIFRRNSAPVERPLLAALTNFLSFRGPDAQQVWTEGCIGFGHAMLRTTREAAHERQPASISDLWITADVRLDCRADLIDKLAQAGCRFCASQITDPELILHAYAIWREACIDHLRGDFAFAVWDAREQKLFCARDQFGIKPFFYSVNERQFLFSNTLNCLRAHPDVSDELNEAAIGDFLLFGLNCDIARTTFRDIQRLSPAHFLVVTPDGFRMQRYWSPPIEGRIRYSRPEEYVEHFREILKAAVADRLRTDRVGIFLSGGLDSGAIAAVAKQISDTAGRDTKLHGCTIVYESLVPSQEKHFAQRTAEFLNISLDFLSMDSFPLFYHWEHSEAAPPEPIEEPFWAAWYEGHAILAKNSRVALSGEAGDNLLLFESWPYAKDLLSTRQWTDFTKSLAQYLWIRPFPWTGLRTRFTKLIGKQGAWDEVYPSWINPDFAKRVSLSNRWRDKSPPLGRKDRHPLFPKGHASLALPHWTYAFELADPGVNRQPLELRHPFLDLRIVTFLLSIPPFPWSFQKRLLRHAMSGLLPEDVRMRPKTPLPGSPVFAALRKSSSLRCDKSTWAAGLDRFVEISQLSQLTEAQSPAEASLIVRPLCLNFWLRSAWQPYSLTLGGK